MIRTIISHDLQTTKARVKFEHNDVVYEDDFQLDLVIPGSRQVMEQMGIEFTKELQLRALDGVEARVLKAIEDGHIINMPVHPEPEPAAAPPPPPPADPVPEE